MLPFERIWPQKVLAPNMIDGQIFKFLISRYAGIWLTSKQWISENIDGQIEKYENLISDQNI